MLEVGYNPTQPWDTLRSRFNYEDNLDFWTKFWDDFVAISNRYDGFSDLPLEVMRSIEQTRDGYTTTLEHSIVELKDFGGLFVGIDHPDYRVRQRLTFLIRSIWDIDSELAMAICVKLAHDDHDHVRYYALEEMMMMLTGQGIDSAMDPKLMGAEDADKLQSILATSISDINTTLGIVKDS